MSVIFHDQIVSPNLPKVKIASSTRVNLSKPKKFDAHLKYVCKYLWFILSSYVCNNYSFYVIEVFDSSKILWCY